MQTAEQPRIARGGLHLEAAPVVSCVVVAYHRANETVRLAQALIDPRVEIIIVNVEDDPAVRQVACHRMVRCKPNIGYGAAVNRGVAASTSGVVVFMNDDVIATASDILGLAQRIRGGESDVAVPLVVGSDGHLELGNRAPLGLARRMLLTGMPVPTTPMRIDAAWAPMIAVRTDVIHTIPMPEAYFLYWEEFEWFYRLRERGIRVELNPSVRIRHSGGPADMRVEKSRLLARNAVRCVARTRGRVAALRAWPIVILWQLQLLLQSLAGGQGSRIRASAAGVSAALGSWREVAGGAAWM